MSERITAKRIRAMGEACNASLARRGAEYRLDVNRRYDYWAIDRCDEAGHVLGTEQAGLAGREVYLYLRGFQAALALDGVSPMIAEAGRLAIAEQRNEALRAEADSLGIDPDIVAPPVCVDCGEHPGRYVLDMPAHEWHGERLCGACRARVEHEAEAAEVDRIYRDGVSANVEAAAYEASDAHKASISFGEPHPGQRFGVEIVVGPADQSAPLLVTAWLYPLDRQFTTLDARRWAASVSRAVAELEKVESVSVNLIGRDSIDQRVTLATFTADGVAWSNRAQEAPTQ